MVSTGPVGKPTEGDFSEVVYDGAVPSLPYKKPHYHRFMMMAKTSNYDEGQQLQSWTERCKCGAFCLVFMRFDKSSNCITPHSKKHWFNRLGELEKTTGDLVLKPKPNITGSQTPLTASE